MTNHQPPDYGQKVDDATDPDHLDALVPQVLQPLPQHVLPAVPHPEDQLVHHVAHLRMIYLVPRETLTRCDKRNQTISSTKIFI